MKKFDLKKAILENKATFHSSLNEDFGKTKMYFHVLEDGGYGDIGHQGVYDTEEEAQSRANELADMFPNSFFYVEASNSEDEPYSVTMEEGKKSKQYYKDAEADDAEHIEALEKDMKDDKKSSKMTKSELKSKIKEMILAEMNLNISDETPESEEDFLAELEAMLYEADKEKDDKKTDKEIDAEEEIDITDEFSTEEPQTGGGINVNQNADADLTGVEKETQDNLEAALEAAKKLGDEKLATQIGNTLTFFTKQHVVK